MRALYFLLALTPFTRAVSKEKCICPPVKCPGEQPAVSAHRSSPIYISMTHMLAAMQLHERRRHSLCREVWYAANDHRMPPSDVDNRDSEPYANPLPALWQVQVQ